MEGNLRHGKRAQEGGKGCTEEGEEDQVTRMGIG